MTGGPPALSTVAPVRESTSSCSLCEQCFQKCIKYDASWASENHVLRLAHSTRTPKATGLVCSRRCEATFGRKAPDKRTNRDEVPYLFRPAPVDPRQPSPGGEARSQHGPATVADTEADDRAPSLAHAVPPPQSLQPQAALPLAVLWISSGVRLAWRWGGGEGGEGRGERETDGYLRWCVRLDERRESKPRENKSAFGVPVGVHCCGSGSALLPHGSGGDEKHPALGFR